MKAIMSRRRRLSRSGMTFAGRVDRLVCTLVLLAACAPASPGPTPTASGADTAKADAVMRIIATRWPRRT